MSLGGAKYEHFSCFHCSCQFGLKSFIAANLFNSARWICKLRFYCIYFITPDMIQLRLQLGKWNSNELEYMFSSFYWVVVFVLFRFFKFFRFFSKWWDDRILSLLFFRWDQIDFFFIYSNLQQNKVEIYCGDFFFCSVLLVF